MTFTQKVVLIALLVLGGLCLIVGFTLMHYIGGFLHTVEEEARESEEEAARAASGAVATDSGKTSDPNQNTESGEEHDHIRIVESKH